MPNLIISSLFQEAQKTARQMALYFDYELDEIEVDNYAGKYINDHVGSFVLYIYLNTIEHDILINETQENFLDIERRYKASLIPSGDFVLMVTHGEVVAVLAEKETPYCSTQSLEHSNFC